MDKKKILTVLPVRTSTANLREDLFATIINYYGYDYQLMMLTSWGFRLMMMTLIKSYRSLLI